MVKREELTEEFVDRKLEIIKKTFEAVVVGFEAGSNAWKENHDIDDENMSKAMNKHLDPLFENNYGVAFLSEKVIRILNENILEAVQLEGMGELLGELEKMLEEVKEDANREEESN